MKSIGKAAAVMAAIILARAALSCVFSGQIGELLCMAPCGAAFYCAISSCRDKQPRTSRAAEN